MAFEDWKKLENGDIMACPLTGYQTATFAQSAIAVKLDYAVAGDRYDAPSGVAQLALTPHQAIELAQALQRAADRILQIKPAGPLS